jgi:hypothetical protein
LIGPVLWLMIPWAAGQALTRVLLAGKRDAQVLLGASIGAGFFVLTLSEAVKRYDALGAVWCAAAAMFLTTACLILALRKSLQLDLRLSLVRPGVAVLSATGVFFTLGFAGPGLAMLGAFVVLLMVGYWLECLTPQDQIWLRQACGWIAHKRSSIQ